jgi:hypothetical protein
MSVEILLIWVSLPSVIRVPWQIPCTQHWLSKSEQSACPLNESAVEFDTLFFVQEEAVSNNSYQS